jgi:putative ABC transport system permease protein
MRQSRMRNLAFDVRYAIRLFFKRPGFAAVAILTLAVGIGATTAIFTVVNAVLLSPLPFRDAERLAQVRIVGQGSEDYPLPDADFLEWRSQNRTADAIAVYEVSPVTISGDGAAEQIVSSAVTDRFFDVLGARPLAGRVFQEGDDKPGAAKSVVLSHAFWTRRFHSDPNVGGRVVTIDGVSHGVIGIMPSDFRFPLDNDIDVWRTLTMNPPPRRGPFYTTGIARLKPGVTLAELRANLQSVEAAIKRQHRAPEDWTLAAVPLQEALVGDVRQILYLLLGAVAFLLLIATANVANLLLARAATREREIAVRGALGAGRGRIVTQLVAESVTLAVVSGLAGLLLAWWGTHAMLALAPRNLPRLDEIRMSVPVFLFALAASSICGVLFGLAPALRASRAPLVETLKEGGRSGSSVSHRRLQRVLVVSEIALALVLSVGAGLMVRSLAALQRVSPGFDPGHLLTFEVSLPETAYRDDVKVRAFYDALMQKLEVIPGVGSVGVAISLPPDLLQVTDNFMIEGQVLPPNQSAPVGPVVMVSDRLFATLGVPILRGRAFDASDELNRADTVIVNETLAKKYLPGVDPIGKRLKIGGPERPVGPKNPWMEIVGVAGDIKYSGLDAPPEPSYYMSYRQNPWNRQFVVVRTSSDPAALASAAREAVASLDKDIPLARVRTMDQLMTASMAPPRFRTLLLAMFAFVGLLLAAIGLYGVVSYAVTERTHELGVRIALGADRADVVRLVLGEALVMAGAGILFGLAGAVATTRLLQSLLFGVGATDTATFAGISVLLLVIALAASYLPTRRATRVDPMVALRYE